MTAGCRGEIRRKHLFCKKCWDKLPLDLKGTTRDLPRQEKKDKEAAMSQSLKARPTANWMERASKYVGRIRQTMTWGHGFNAVKIKEEAAH